jgi:hypothetical protein
MITFKYNKKIDEECWNRIIKAQSMFGHDFPTAFSISEEDVVETKNKTNEFQKIWDTYNKKHDFNKGIKKIYQHHFSKNLICYINTSPYSMDNFAKNYISISMRRDTPQKIITTTIHEASHFIFRKYYTDFCRKISCGEEDIENIKEIITAINNFVFPCISDSGWKTHSDFREKIIKIWQKTKNIEKSIILAKKLLDKNPIS